LEECDQSGEEDNDQGGEEAASVSLSLSGEETRRVVDVSSSESSDDLPPLEDSEEEERKTWKEKDDPFKIHVSSKDIDLMEKNLPNFLKAHPMGDGWSIRVPPPDGTISWEDTERNANGYFGCYEAAFRAGLRFPLHQAVKAILRGYGLGVWQLSHNSWANILGYVAACEFQGVHPGWEAFAKMHYLSRNPGGFRAWYTLSTLPQYMMTLDKVSKFDGWKHRFYLCTAPTKRENYELRLYNKKPDLMGRKCCLPRIPDEDFDKIIEADLFGLTDATLSTGEVIKVPKNWIPKSAWFRDECFLAACGLGHMFDRSMRLNHFRLGYFCVGNEFLVNVLTVFRLTLQEKH
jgi:hypothetical protein